jgi:hypothetical protein
VIAEVLDAADPDPAGEVGDGPPAQDDDLEPLGPGGCDVGQAPQRGASEGFDPGGHRIERDPREGAVEVGHDEEPARDCGEGDDPATDGGPGGDRGADVRRRACSGPAARAGRSVHGIGRPIPSGDADGEDDGAAEPDGGAVEAVGPGDADPGEVDPLGATDGLVPGEDGGLPDGDANDPPGEALVDGEAAGDAGGLVDGLGRLDGLGVGWTGLGTKARAAAIRSAAVRMPASSARTTARRGGMAGRVPVPSGGGGPGGDRLG